MGRVSGTLAVAAFVLSCRLSDESRGHREGPPAAEAAVATTARDDSLSSRRKVARITPEIISKAEEILHSNPHAEFGTEFPFELDGKKYVARVEEHDNPDGDPNRPQGLHKGITVYSED